MKNKILYHGSKDIIEKPIYGGGKATNDYGYGFYCTESLDLANEWACPDNNDGYANKYELDLNGLNILDLTKPEYNILNWMALLLQFRMPEGVSPNAEQAKEYILKNFSVDLSKVDVIIGYRADDSYFSFARDFLRNTITVAQLSRAMELGKLGMDVEFDIMDDEYGRVVEKGEPVVIVVDETLLTIAGSYLGIDETYVAPSTGVSVVDETLIMEA